MNYTPAAQLLCRKWKIRAENLKAEIASNNSKYRPALAGRMNSSHQGALEQLQVCILELEDAVGKLEGE